MLAPRWEWRTFGEHFGEAESALAHLSPYQVVESRELYLLSAADAEVAKVRDGLMDVKQLQRRTDDGLELWLPVRKNAFPLSPAEVGAVLTDLGIEAPASLTRTEYSLAALLEEVVGPDPGLLALEVVKRRQRYTVHGCTAELTHVRAGLASTRSIAIESEDATLVLAAVRELGLASRPNTNYPRGLKALVGFGTQRFAVIDVGTNSVKFHIGERRADGSWRTILDRAEITRLGEGLQQTGLLGPGPMTRTAEAIARMAEEARLHGVSATAAVGTAGLRIAPNGVDFVTAVQARCGVLIDIVSGEAEARLAYRAATAGLRTAGSRVVFDTGGGSSQFSFGNGDRVDERFSVEVGAVRFTEEYGLFDAVSQEVLAAALGAIDTDLVRLDGRSSPETLVGMGGAVTNLAAVKHGLAEYDPDIVQGTVLDRAEIDRQIELYRTRNVDHRRTVVGLQPQRADTILAGACIVRTVLGKLGRASLTVSDRGLRYGVLAERFGSVDHPSPG